MARNAKALGHKIDLGFGSVCAQSKPRPIEIKIIKQAFLANRRIFGRNIPAFKIFLCHNKSSLKTHAKYYYHPLMLGTVMHSGDVVFKSLAFSKRSSRFYLQAMRHELNHVFWLITCARRGEPWCPLWLAEALAVTVGQHDMIQSKRKVAGYIKQHTCPQSLLHYRYLPKRFRTREEVWLWYSLWHYFFLDLFGANAKKAMPFLCALGKTKGRDGFEKLFQKRFRTSIDQKFAEFRRRQLKLLAY